MLKHVNLYLQSRSLCLNVLFIILKYIYTLRTNR